MSYRTLSIQRTDYVVVVTILGPDDQEKMAQLSNEVMDLCEEITRDENIRVMILGSPGGNTFSFEIDSTKSIPKSYNKPLVKCGFMAEPIANLDRPVIAAIGGDAIGLGLELVLACDIRIATEISQFELPQIKAGHIPWDGGTQRLSRLVGRGKALEMILTGEVIGAQEALRIGLVNKVVPKKDLTEMTMKMAHEMASKGPIALRYTKEAVYKGMDMTLEQGLRLEADLYLLIHTSKDRSEGIQAFREKKKPKFEGK